MITAKLGTNRVRLSSTTTFDMDTADVQDLVLDYSGELGSDTVSAVTKSTENLTAATPSISSNVVTISLSGAIDGTKGWIEVNMTTTASNVINRKIYIRGADL